MEDPEKGGEKKEIGETLPAHHLEAIVQQIKKALTSDTQELLQILKHPRRFMWQNFLLGVVRGLGIAFGMTVLGALLVAFFLLVLRWLENLPLIGAFFRHVVDLVRDFLSQRPVPAR